MEASEIDYGESTGGNPATFWENLLRKHAENAKKEHSLSQDLFDEPFFNEISAHGDSTSANAISHTDLDRSVSQFSALDKVLGKNVLQSSALDQVLGKNVLQSSALDQVLGKNVLQSSSPDQVPGKNVLQSLAPDQVPDKNVLQSSAPDQVPGKNELQSSAPDQVPGKNELQSSAPDQIPLNMSDNLALHAPTVPNKKIFQNPEQMESIDDDEFIYSLFANPKQYLENNFPKLTEEQEKSLDQEIQNIIIRHDESWSTDAASQSLSPGLLSLQDGVTLGKNVPYSSALDQSVGQNEKQVLSVDQTTGKNVPQGSVLDQAPGNNTLQASAHDTTYISSCTQTPDKMSYNTALPVHAVNQISDKKTLQSNSVKTQTLTQSQETHGVVSVAYILKGESKKLEIQVDSHNPTPQSNDFLTAIPHNETSGDLSVSKGSLQRCLKRECDITSTSDTSVMGKKPKLHEIKEPFTDPGKEHERRRAIYQHQYRERKKRESKDNIKELNQERARREDIEKQLEIMTRDRDHKTTMIQHLQKQLDEAAEENVKKTKVICLLEKNLELKTNECNTLWKTHKELLNVSLQQNDKTQ